ncbi:MAG: hypothetical protein Q9170_007959, partial [Blastenia crenularia]
DMLSLLCFVLIAFHLNVNQAVGAAFAPIPFASMVKDLPVTCANTSAFTPPPTEAPPADCQLALTQIPDNSSEMGLQLFQEWKWMPNCVLQYLADNGCRAAKQCHVEATDRGNEQHDKGLQPWERNERSRAIRLYSSDHLQGFRRTSDKSESRLILRGKFLAQIAQKVSSCAISLSKQASE